MSRPWSILAPGVQEDVLHHHPEELPTQAWGFPLTTKGAKGQPLKPKPVNNTRADKLDSFMWRHSFAERRCLIPVTQFAAAEGEQGAKTRTWFLLPHQDVFVCAGIWRDTPEWGPAYSMVMTEACVHVADVHERMPVILRRDDWSDWLDGLPNAAALLCCPYPDLMLNTKAADRWVHEAAIMQERKARKILKSEAHVVKLISSQQTWPCCLIVL